jgi:hypothetical protein
VIWYHGSPELLAVIRAGSSITPTESVARGFSHKPEFLDVSNNGASIRHNGNRDGYLYVVDEVMAEDDIEIHPASVDDLWFEWLVKRDVRVRLLRRTEINAGELLSESEIAEYRERLKANGGQNSFEKRED